ncbi:helix-turn-helix domain-containing protein [soil metagenome]
MTPSSPMPPHDPAMVRAVMVAGRQVANVLCDRWSLLILLSAHAGATRFSEFRERWGMSSRMLGARLAALEEQEVMVRLAYSRRPLRHSYHLTHMGLALFDVFAAMLQWEQRTAPAGARIGLGISHQPCGNPAAQPSSCCAACSAEVSATNVEILVKPEGAHDLPAWSTSYRRSAPRSDGEDTTIAVPLPRSLAIYGDKWSNEIIMCAYNRVSTFGDMQSFTGMSSNILADRLSRLVAGGILRQEPAALDGQRQVYRLSADGRALFPVVLTMWDWADKWLKDRRRAPLQLRHRDCGEPVRLTLKCDQCGGPLERSQCQLYFPPD